MALIESIPNISEGRRPEVVAGCVEAVRGSGASLLDVSSDAAHNRSVLTIAGDAARLEIAVCRLFDRAIASIDLRAHQGVHPRVGAVDVVPFVPLGSTPMADCVALARHVAAAVAERHGLPVYLYEEAALRPERRRLELIRRGQFEGLTARLRQPEWAPDFGPAAPHPTAGASIIGARRPLIAYNVNLATHRLDVAKAIATRVRESSGGLPAVKALGVMLAPRGIAQVTMNLTDPARTPMTAVFDLVQAEAKRHGVEILESELVGLVPEAALPANPEERLRLTGFSPTCILENRLRAAGEMV